MAIENLLFWPIQPYQLKKVSKGAATKVHMSVMEV